MALVQSLINSDIDFIYNRLRQQFKCICDRKLVIAREKV